MLRDKIRELITDYQHWGPNSGAEVWDSCFTLRSNVSFRGLGLGLTDCTTCSTYQPFRGPSAETQLSTTTRHTPKAEVWNIVAWYSKYFPRPTFKSPNIELSRFQINEDCWSNRINGWQKFGDLTYLVVNSGEEFCTKILWGHASINVLVQMFAQLFVGWTAPISALVLTVDFRLQIRRLMDLWTTSVLHQTSGIDIFFLSSTKCRGSPIEIN